MDDNTLIALFNQQGIPEETVKEAIHSSNLDQLPSNVVEMIHELQERNLLDSLFTNNEENHSQNEDQD